MLSLKSASAWLETAGVGTCGTTPPASGDCQRGTKGSFTGFAQQMGHRWRAATLACLQMCNGCARCRYVSISLKWRDCSWFSMCTLSALDTGVAGFKSGLAIKAAPPAPPRLHRLPACDTSAFTGSRCLPGRMLRSPALESRLCDTSEANSAAVSSICCSSRGAPPCTAWASGTIHLSRTPGHALLGERPCAATSRKPGPRHKKEPPVHWRDPCQREAVSRADFLALSSGRTILFVGDSLVRQLYLRTIAWLRGQRNVVDVPFHNDAVYLVATPRMGTRGTHDVLLPLWEFYRSNCALARLDGHEDAPTAEQPGELPRGTRLEVRAAREDANCRTARESSVAYFDARAAKSTELYKGVQAQEVRQAATAVRLVAGLLDEQLSANWSRTPHTRLVFRFYPAYSPELFNGIAGLRPHILVAGALGGHVPCWSNGKPGRRSRIKSVHTTAGCWRGSCACRHTGSTTARVPTPAPGNRCSIENVPESMHASFWRGARAHFASNRQLRHFSWITFPFAHTGSRYQNGNYSHFNERARQELNAMRSRHAYGYGLLGGAATPGCLQRRSCSVTRPF